MTASTTFGNYIIRDTVLAGNLFNAQIDGINPSASADKFAALITERIQSEYPDIVIAIDVQHNAEGASRSRSVDGDDYEQSEEIAARYDAINEEVFISSDWLVHN